jgi:hypothetical protein
MQHSNTPLAIKGGKSKEQEAALNPHSIPTTTIYNMIDNAKKKKRKSKGKAILMLVTHLYPTFIVDVLCFAFTRALMLLVKPRTKISFLFL